MVEVLGAVSAVRFTSKDLGLNVGLWDCFLKVRGWIFRAVFRQSSTEILGLFSDSLELDYETDFWTVDVYRLVCITKVNNICSCENHVVICSIDVLAWVV